ncbi:MAG: hypothetical protein R2748_06695 [Bryobacterales bacterium]
MLRSFAAGSAILLLTFMSASAETHRFEPKRYHNTFSFAHEPVLRVKPGDRIVTKTIDARGFDAANNQVGERPNPQTGPFYVEGAEPGDVLWCTSRRSSRPARPPGRAACWRPYAADPAFLRFEGEREQTTETWNIDKQRGVARVASDAILPRGIEVPLQPMLGLRRRSASA